MLPAVGQRVVALRAAVQPVHGLAAGDVKPVIERRGSVAAVGLKKIRSSGPAGLLRQIDLNRGADAPAGQILAALAALREKG